MDMDSQEVFDRADMRGYLRGMELEHSKSRAEGICDGSPMGCTGCAEAEWALACLRENRFVAANEL